MEAVPSFERQDGTTSKILVTKLHGNLCKNSCIFLSIFQNFLSDSVLASFFFFFFKARRRENATEQIGPVVALAKAAQLEFKRHGPRRVSLNFT